jgi:hypothetical protein
LTPGRRPGTNVALMNRFDAYFFYFFGFFSPKHMGGCTNA